MLITWMTTKSRFFSKSDSLAIAADSRSSYKKRIMKLVLFDVDGTLIDSQAIIHESMRLTFLRFGYEEPVIQATRSIIGLSLDSAIASICGREIDDEILAMTNEYKSTYLELAKREEMQSLPFNGIPGLINRLATRSDILLGIVTGKSRRGVEKLLASPNFENRFVVSRCADDCPSKPNPAMVSECCDEVGISCFNTIVIGDTGFDMAMAVSAGATAIGVGWGYHPLERIISDGAHHVVHSVNMLEQSLYNLIGAPVEQAEVSSVGNYGSWNFLHA